MTKYLRFLVVVGMIVVLLFHVSCKKGEEQAMKTIRIKVVTSLFPLYDFARGIGKEKADVVLLLPPGVEAHGFEPRPMDIANLNKADIFVYTNKYMEPWVEDILKGVDKSGLVIVDSSKGITLLKETEGEHKHSHKHDHGGIDPHIWLDFFNAKKMVDNILVGIIKKDPVNKDFYQKNAEEYKAKLSELDKKYSDALFPCKNKVFIHGGHYTFGYLAKRYNLRYIAAYEGFSPRAEPTPRKIAQLVRTMKEHGLSHLFYEELINPRVAEIIARETKANLLMLHATHNISKGELEHGETFISLMEKNLVNLIKGLQCQ